MFKEIKPGTKFKCVEAVPVYWSATRSCIGKGETVTFVGVDGQDGMVQFTCDFQPVKGEVVYSDQTYFREFFTFA